MTTKALIPGYMDPIYRFRKGNGELQLAANGAAFNLWEALAVFGDEQFPIVVEETELQLEELLYEAATILAADPDRPRAAGARSEQVERVVARCKAAGFDPALYG